MNPPILIRRLGLLGLVCLWLANGWAVAADPGNGVSEYQLKAAYLYNFTKFTDWPANAFATTNAPIIIGIIGEDPFGPPLDETVRGELVNHRPLRIKRLGTDAELRGCQVVFISRSEADRLPAVLGVLAGRPVLTVSDINGFAQRGGMVNLRLVSKSVKMEVNPMAAKAAGLKISSKLLQLAAIVETAAPTSTLKP